MKKLLLVLCLVFSGCNGQPAPDSPVDTSTTQAATTAPVQASQPTFKTAVITAADGSIAAYIVGFGNQGVASVYVPSLDLYTQIHLKTGKYLPINTFYSGPNGSGTAYSSGWIGEIGKSIVFNGSNYYIAESIQTDASVTVQSFCTDGAISNTSTQTLGWAIADFAVLTPTTRPYDFTALAPIHVVYQ
jgi:hypothetical protein